MKEHLNSLNSMPFPVASAMMQLNWRRYCCALLGVALIHRLLPKNADVMRAARHPWLCGPASSAVHDEAAERCAGLAAPAPRNVRAVLAGRCFVHRSEE